MGQGEPELVAGALPWYHGRNLDNVLWRLAAATGALPLASLVVCVVARVLPFAPPLGQWTIGFVSSSQEEMALVFDREAMTRLGHTGQDCRGRFHHRAGCPFG